MNCTVHRRHAVAAAAMLSLAPVAAQAASFDWSTGTFVNGVAAPNPLAAADTLNVLFGNFKAFDGASFVFTNDGTVNWATRNSIDLQNGARVVNNKLWNVTTSTALFHNGGAATRFTNNSILRTSAGEGMTIANAAWNSVGRLHFVNNGTLDARSGSITFREGHATFNSGTVFTGAGSNVIASGDYDFNGNITSNNLKLDGGVFTGNAARLGGRGASLSGGTLAGTWAIGRSSILRVGSGTFKAIVGNVVNNGTIIWGNSNPLYLQNLRGNTAKLQNDGTIDIAADMQFVNNGGTPTFVNAGLIRKSGGTGTSTIGNGLGFDNKGSIDVRNGTLALPANFANSGVLAGIGSYSVSGTLTNAAGGKVAPGPLPGTGTLALAGNFMQAAGGTFAVDLESLASHDLFKVGGTAALAGALSINCFASCSLAVGDVVTILDSADSLSGSFDDGVVLSGFASGAFDVVYDTVGKRVQLLVTQAVTAVPEPSTYLMLLAGIGVLGLFARRRVA